MKGILLLAVAASLMAACSGQGLLGNLVSTASRLIEPIVNINNGQDGYRFRYRTDDQTREEQGQFENGIWTVRGMVEWKDAVGNKHREMYVADDKGYNAQVEDEPAERGLSGGALASLTG